MVLTSTRITSRSGTVSYTHLDVYKRQSLVSLIAQVAFDDNTGLDVVIQAAWRQICATNNQLRLLGNCLLYTSRCV